MEKGHPEQRMEEYVLCMLCNFSSLVLFDRWSSHMFCVCVANVALASWRTVSYHDNVLFVNLICCVSDVLRSCLFWAWPDLEPIYYETLWGQQPKFQGFWCRQQISKSRLVHQLPVMVKIRLATSEVRWWGVADRSIFGLRCWCSNVTSSGRGCHT